MICCRDCDWLAAFRKPRTLTHDFGCREHDLGRNPWGRYRDRGDQAVTPLWDCFNIAWILRIVPERFAKLRYHIGEHFFCYVNISPDSPE